MANYTLKYGVEIKELGLPVSCPDSNSRPRNYTEVYRFIKTSLVNPDNYIPQSIIKRRNGGKPPERKFKTDGSPDLESMSRVCTEWGISLFTSLEKIRVFYETFPHYSVKKKWTFIASGEIKESDGVCTEPEPNSHFNLFEYKDVDLTSRFGILEDVNPDGTYS